MEEQTAWIPETGEPEILVGTDYIAVCGQRFRATYRADGSWGIARIAEEKPEEPDWIPATEIPRFPPAEAFFWLFVAACAALSGWLCLR
jgi:hypothetical protein